MRDSCSEEPPPKTSTQLEPRKRKPETRNQNQTKKTTLSGRKLALLISIAINLDLLFMAAYQHRK